MVRGIVFFEAGGPWPLSSYVPLDIQSMFFSFQGYLLFACRPFYCLQAVPLSFAQQGFKSFKVITLVLTYTYNNFSTITRTCLYDSNHSSSNNVYIK